MQKISLKESYKGSLPWLVDNTIFATIHGSRAYGTSTPTSDIDIKGICVPPKQYFFGFQNKFEQAEGKDPDMVIYDIRKFFFLAGNCNPNIIEILYTDESNWVTCNPTGRFLVDNRDAFLSMRAKYTFSGYAISQLRRINNHYQWIKNPPKAPPTRGDFDLPESIIIPADQLGAAETEIKKKMEEWDVNWDLVEPADRINMQNRIASMLAESKLSQDETYIVAARSLGFNDNFIDYLKKERAYKNKRQEWDSYQNWLRGRNEKRAELERKYGFDTKHASHLVRLECMAEEIITTGDVIVDRRNPKALISAEQLLAIRNGAWTYEQLIEWTDQQEKKLEAIYQNQLKTKKYVIPYAPDRKRLDELCQKAVEQMLG